MGHALGSPNLEASDRRFKSSLVGFPLTETQLNQKIYFINHERH